MIYALTALTVAAGLLLFDDVDRGLPIVNLIVWPAVALAGVLVAFRSQKRRLRRSSRSRSTRMVRHAPDQTFNRGVTARKPPLEITRR